MSMTAKAHKAGIGLSLKAQMRHEEMLFKTTGFYHGLKELRLKKEDPIKYELLFSRLQSLVIGAQQTGSKVACSPGTREVGESVVGLYTPEGDAVAFSGGIMVHVHTMSRFIKWMIEHDYEISPGIQHGDIFENNDTYIGGVHIPDVMDVTPIFYEGELIGWTGMVTHVLEVGGITPGSMPVLATERFTEGVHICAEKVGSNDELHKDYEVRIERSVRSPALWILDTKARITGALIARDEVLATIEEFGIDYYKQAIREFIEEGRRAQLERVRTMLIPGKYKEVTCDDQIMEGQSGLHPLAEPNVMIVIPLEMEIDREGKMHIDFDGAGSWRYWSGNATPAALEGGFFVSLTQTMNYDGRVNDGSFLATEIKFPKGTWAWPDNVYVSTSLAWNAVMPAWANWYRMMARGFFVRGFLEEVFLVGATTPVYDAGGIDQYGKIFGGTNFELAAQGSGARGIMDGIDFGYVLWNPESDMGNIEIWEQLFPQVYLARKILPDSHGFGKFRGGSGWQSLLLTHGTNQLVLTTELCQAKAFDHQGLFGGYPGKIHYLYVVRDSNIQEVIANRQLIPTGEGDDPNNPEIAKLLKGELELAFGNYTASRPLKENDILLMQYRGMGGFGDPIERDITLIEKDLENGIVTVTSAERIHGVVVQYDDQRKAYRVDVAATEKKRQKIREERLRRGRPAEEWIEEQRQRILAYELPKEILEIYKDIESHSEKWMNEFREFWGLDASFTFQKEHIRDINPIAVRYGKSKPATDPSEF